MIENGRPLIVHIIRRLSVGGLENGLVNLINHMDPTRYRHAIVCLKDYDDFYSRIKRKDVDIIALQKREGQNLSIHARLWKVIRKLQPSIVHTRNLPGLEYLVPSTLAGVPGRIHGEHGRDMYDLDGLNKKYLLLRKLVNPFTHQYIAVSGDLANWLIRSVGIRSDRVTQIYNGVDLKRFHPREGSRPSLGPPDFASAENLVIGTVGRMETVKNQLTLVQAFVHLLNQEPNARESLRLVIIGDGPLRMEAEKLLRDANADRLAWLPGEREDVPAIMRSLDLFALPSLREGISNTILEAMASGLPVVATRVGGNPELVEERKTGLLIPPANSIALAGAIRSYLLHPELLSIHGQAGRKRAEDCFSLEKMVSGYTAVYDKLLERRERADR
jgi:sugar transferase (PEP-CTERM/EpsH1 system associated)